MARPQTEHGFVMIALDLFAALMVADLPNRCMIVLTEVLVTSYGPEKKRDVFLDPAVIEDHSGLHRNNARRAIRELVEAGILARQPNGMYRFIKDYESWTPGGQPLTTRLGGGPLRLASWAQNRPARPIKPSEQDAIQRDSAEDTTSINASALDAIQRDCPIDDQPNPAGLPFSPQPQSNGIGSDIYGNPTGLRSTPQPESGGIGPDSDAYDASPCDDTSLSLTRARTREDFKNLENKKEKHTHAHAHAHAYEHEHEHEPIPSEGPSSPRKSNQSPSIGQTSGKVVGPGRDSPEAIALEEWAKKLGNDPKFESYAFWARTRCDYAPAEWIRALLENRVDGRSGFNRVNVGLLQHILGEWMNAGECPYLRATPSIDPDPRKETPGERRDRNLKEQAQRMKEKDRVARDR